MNASNKMGNVFEKCVKEIEGVLDGKQATDVTRMAVATLGVYSRLKATEIHESSLRCQIVGNLGGDTKMLKTELKALGE